MDNTSTSLVGKKVLVVSDSDKLSRAIELNLSFCLGIETVTLATDTIENDIGSDIGNDIGNEGDNDDEGDNDNFDLIVVAMSSPVSEPVVALARASLSDYIGRVPILIISDRPVNPAPDAYIAHLDYPFNASGLHNKIKEILRNT